MMSSKERDSQRQWLSPEFNHIDRPLITFDLSPLCRYWLRLHCDRVPAEYLLHRHPGLGCLLPVPGRAFQMRGFAF